LRDLDLSGRLPIMVKVYYRFPVTPVVVHEWHICITGYSQQTGEPTGLHKLWQRLGRLRKSDVCVELREWNSDWRKVAELIWLTSQNGKPPRITIYAYSWGAGYGFVQLARELKRRGLSVDAAVLADPVYHSRHRLTRWLAMVANPLIRIHVPANVREVFWTRQTCSRPCAHDLVADSDDTLIHPARNRTATHTYMDDDPFFHHMALEVSGLLPRTKEEE
jgi:hypothetical protein